MMLPVSAERLEEGFLLRFRGEEYAVRYPPAVWRTTPRDIQELLIDNLTVAATMHLPMVIEGIEGLSYNRPTPLFEPYFFQNFLRDIPSCADIDGLSPEEETTRFLTKRFSWTDDPIRRPSANQSLRGGGEASRSRAVVPMSFGKDSLLTYCIAEELGLEPVMVYVEEPSFHNEARHKLAIAEEFASRFGGRLQVIRHETGLLRDYDYLGVRGSEYGWGLQSSEYALLMLPFCYAYRADLILFGNEQSAGSSYVTRPGALTTYPCYDQTHHWTRHIDQMTRAVTTGCEEIPRGVTTASVIEPLMDLMVQHALIHRYPRQAAFQMSCFVEEEKHEGRWCEDCTICAKMYLLCVASGQRPESIGFRGSMLTEEKSSLFTSFGGLSRYPYARTDLAREEELFAFYAAYRLGARDELVMRFRESSGFAEALERTAELHNKFCTLYPAITLPEPLADGVGAILKEEIGAYMRRWEKE